MDYTALENALKTAIDPEAEAYLAAEAKAAGMPEEISRGLFLGELAKPIVEVLSMQPEFAHGYMIRLDSGSCGFHSDPVASKLADRALRDSPSSAIEWLQKILGTEAGSGIVVSAIWGLNAASRMELTDDLAIVPIAELPDSYQKERLLNRRITFDLMDFSAQKISPPPKAALVRSVKIDPFIWDYKKGDPPGRDDSLVSQTMLREVRAVLALVSNVPLVDAIHWFQFDDPDLQDANLYSGTGSYSEEIVPQRYDEGSPINKVDAASVVASLLAADETVKDRVLISVGRFSQSLLRFMPGDKAVELSIALEALLVDDRGENTHKVGLRAALVAGGTQAERIRKRSVVTAIYSLRSALMHSGRVPEKVKVKGQGKQSPADVVTEATDIVREVIRNVLEAGKLPDWWSLEVSSGN